jgi:ABC-type molybdate transport system ATPase subunit
MVSFPAAVPKSMQEKSPECVQSDKPASLAVARITGVDTVEPARILAVAEGLATVAVGQTQLVALAGDGKTGDGYIGVRAEDVILEKETAGPSRARIRLPGQIRTMMRERPMVRIILDCGFRLTALITKAACLAMDLREGDRVMAPVKVPAIQLILRDS